MFGRYVFGIEFILDSCFPRQTEFPMTGYIGQTKTVTLYKSYFDYSSYTTACASALFTLSSNPTWITLDTATYVLTLSPNSVSDNGDYTFDITHGDDTTTLSVSISCGASASSCNTGTTFNAGTCECDPDITSCASGATLDAGTCTAEI